MVVVTSPHFIGLQQPTRALTQMESSDFDNVKAEKASALGRYNSLRSAAKLFRLAELGSGMALLTWTFTRLPFALNISRDYFRLLSGVVSSHLFVFILCHVIIASLFLKSRHVATPAHNNQKAVDSKLYEELIENSGGGEGTKSQLQKGVVSGVKEEEEDVYQDKQIISEVSSADPKADAYTDSDSDSDLSTESEFPKVIRRTRSEKFEREQTTGKLRRSETGIYRKTVKSGEECLPAEDLSNEEFQHTIEAFIEKQRRFRRQESMVIVLQH